MFIYIGHASIRCLCIISLCVLHLGKSQFSSRNATVSYLSFPSLWRFLDSYIPLFSYKDTSINFKFLFNTPPVYFLILHTVSQQFQQLFITVPGSSAPNSISPLLPLALAIFRLRRTQYLSHFICRGISWRPAPFGGINASLKALSDQLQSPSSRAVVLGWPAVERPTQLSSPVSFRSFHSLPTVHRHSRLCHCFSNCRSVCLPVRQSVCRYSFMLHTVVCACKYICMCICVSFAVVVDGHLLAALLASVWLPFYAPQMKMQTDNGRQRRLRIWLRERTTTTRTTTSDDDVALLKTMAATAVGAVRWQHGHMPHAACRMPLCSIHFLHAFELWAMAWQGHRETHKNIY